MPPVVLVTGAARRLGREIALGLATAGWQVAVHYRGSAAEALQTVADCNNSACPGARCEAFQADLADEAATAALVGQVCGHFGQLDALVNNASLFEHDDAASFTYAGLQAHLAANTGAPVLLARELHRHLQGRQAQGAVVNLLDQKLWNPNPDFLSYTLSKAALKTATTALAMALAPVLRVVGVAPGLTLTSHMLSDEKFEQLHRLSPLGRSSTPADVVSAVRFALENAALTGTTLLVDGGQHLMKFDRDFSLM
ncbi:SDR family oxidoreductase [Ramlibacter sp. AW1]|uniref:SDR family oxidoreductase n=1 Tax=Ramlibacter aurantiacus TaxID=2801330 RepID=A0A936ZQF8_9BURK|nr:SDR family oxidoreductase [Ramlibacter aurantiacus]MBL0421690.1 SDR family oxidoreductase [Ramlibacter aurantiacus]